MNDRLQEKDISKKLPIVYLVYIWFFGTSLTYMDVCNHYNGSRSVCARVTLVHLNIRAAALWVDEIKPNQGDAVLSASQTETYCTASCDNDTCIA